MFVYFLRYAYLYGLIFCIMNASGTKTIKRALLSVYHKDRMEEIINCLHQLNVEIYATGGTLDFIRQTGHEAHAIEALTGYPSILGGRVKTLHPKVFGGILARSGQDGDEEQLQEYGIPTFDLVVVDLYPFEETVKNGKNEQDIIEKIDIGGISLIRAAAKNYADVLVTASRNQYDDLIAVLNDKQGSTTLSERRRFAAQAFQVSSHYDTAIFNYFNQVEAIPALRLSIDESIALRYGENPHQQGRFYGQFNDLFDQLHGKEISYNNLLDIGAAAQLIDEFDGTALAILKHNNACGMAVRPTLVEAWNAALAADPLSAFGGIIITNTVVDAIAAKAINNIFFEVIIAPEYTAAALEVLKYKKNRIILLRKNRQVTQKMQYRSLLNGILAQDKDLHTSNAGKLTIVTECTPSAREIEDMVFANKLVKHTKSNAIVLVKNQQLCGSGTGQTSRVDALRQAIEKANNFGFDLRGAVMASDAFFPFPDCVEIAHSAGITAVIHPGGSIKDQDSIDFCNKQEMAMVITGIRHFKH